MKNILLKLWRNIPFVVRNMLDIIRRCPEWKKHNAIFIHIPKAAGVSVNRAIYGRPLGHFYAIDIKNLCPHTFDELFTFTVVRHPIDRLYSAYRFSRKGGTNVMGMQNPDYYINHPDFESFERFVMNWLIRQDLKKVDGVFRPQYLYFFDDKEKLLVDVFYKLEIIEGFYDEISIKLGKPFSLGHHNQSEKEELNISKDLKKVIFQLYKKDFELLGYSLDKYDNYD